MHLNSEWTPELHKVKNFHSEVVLTKSSELCYIFENELLEDILIKAWSSRKRKSEMIIVEKEKKTRNPLKYKSKRSKWNFPWGQRDVSETINLREYFLIKLETLSASCSLLAARSQLGYHIFYATCQLLIVHNPSSPFHVKTSFLFLDSF